jgi:predicted RNA-binding protein with PIN domain
MGQTPGWHRDRPAARRRLLEQLASFARCRKARITVVFDGAPDSAFPEGSALGGVKVLYAERGSNADARIEKLVETARDRRGLTVVTSDRHLAFLVCSCGASVIRSGQFRRQVESAVASGPDRELGDNEAVGDVGEWLAYFGSMAGEDEDD